MARYVKKVARKRHKKAVKQRAVRYAKEGNGTHTTPGVHKCGRGFADKDFAF